MLGVAGCPEILEDIDDGELYRVFVEIFGTRLSRDGPRSMMRCGWGARQRRARDLSWGRLVVKSSIKDGGLQKHRTCQFLDL